MISKSRYSQWHKVS